jgi:hypothetical protein
MSLVLDGTNGLSEVDGSAATPAIRGTDTNTGIFFPAADTIAFAEGGAEVAQFNSAGNFGLKVTPSASWQAGRAVMQIGPAMAFDCNNQTQAIVSANRVFTGSQDLYLNSGNATAYQQFSGAHSWFTAPSGTAGNAISFTQAMTLDASGNLLVGSASRFSSERLTLSSAGANDVIFANTAGGGTGYVYRTNTSSGLAGYFITSAGQAGLISCSGTTTSYNSGSDYRLKDNVRPLTGALETVAKLKPVAFEWKHDGSYGDSFLAHELAEVCPQAVFGEKDAVNEDGSIKPQGIDTSFLVATLTAAIQEQQALIQTLTARVTALDARLISLEGTQP